MNEFGKVLPSDFIPQFRDTIPTIRLEGSSKEYELPEIEDQDDDVMTSRMVANNSEHIKKIQDLQKEINMQKEEHKDNIKDLNSKI